MYPASTLFLSMPIIQLESIIISEGLGATNEILPESQRMHVLDLVKDTEKECQDLDAEIFRVQLYLASLQNKRAKYASHMENLHTAIAPCKHLPSEILARIFIQCLGWRDSLGRSLNIPVDKVNGPWLRQHRPGLLPAPWILGQICSRWRQIALREKRLWNSISFAGNSRNHLEMLEEAFKCSGQSALQLEAEESFEGSSMRENNPLLSLVVCPQSHRISSLHLHIRLTTYEDFLLLPSGLFDELVCVEVRVHEPWAMRVTTTATVFQSTPHLRRATLPPCSSLLALALPWHQLAYLGVCSDLDHFLEIISLCTNLRECRITLPVSVGQFPTKIFPPAGIQLPHLRKLSLNIYYSPGLPYSDFFRPLVLPNLEEFAFDLNATSYGRLAELSQAIEGLGLPNLLLEFDDAGVDDVMRIACALPPLTTIKAPNRVLQKSFIDIIPHDPCCQKLTSLEMSIRYKDTEAFIEMLRVQWSRARQLNMHLGIRSATIYVPDASTREVSQLSVDMRQVQKQLRVLDSQIIFYCSSYDASRESPYIES